MATYAAFKHVELYNVGKTKKRVLRPPGGGSSDIFGADLPQTPRVVKNHMQSNIFSTEKDAHVKNTSDQPRRAQKNLDSYQRLFGEPERPFTPAKNHMKSNIPFGAKTEAAQQLLTNGTNGHAHHNHSTSGKTGSVSSASSSVSSSTENLKMNGFSKSADNEVCAQTPTPESGTESAKSEASLTKPCENISASGGEPGAGEPAAGDQQSAEANAALLDSSRNPITGLGLNGDGVGGWKPKKAKQRGGHKLTQTRRGTGTNPEYPYSLSEPVEGVDPNSPCGGEQMKLTEPRNPLIGVDLDDCVTGRRHLKARNREGNPVTGEGYTGPVNVPGVHPVINKNRVPPGGYSSGLW